MRKKLVYILALVITLALTACGESTETVGSANKAAEEMTVPADDSVKPASAADSVKPASEESTSDVSAAVGETDNSGLDVVENASVGRHFYRTVRIIAFADAMMPSMTGIMENIFGFGEYLPTITFHYDTETGIAERAEYATYYSYSPYGENEFLQMDMEALSGDGELCSRFSNFKTEVMEEDEVTKLSFDMDISTYFTYFDPHINLYFVEKEQDIEGYKNAVYYERIDNYLDPKPTCEEGEGFFYDQISCRRIEWED